MWEIVGNCGKVGKCWKVGNCGKTVEIKVLTTALTCGIFRADKEAKRCRRATPKAPEKARTTPEGARGKP